MKIEDVLETFKQQGNYGISLIYGEDVGCDDLDIPQNEREIKIIMTPVGYLGEVRKMVVTNLKGLRDFDFSKKPQVISNPPKHDEYRKNGYYVWGTESSVKDFV